MRNRSDAMPVEVLAFFCCFRVAILRRLEPENTSRLGPNRGPDSARLDQNRAGSGWLRYAAFERLDLLDSSLVALISGFFVSSYFVAGFLVARYSCD